MSQRGPPQGNPNYYGGPPTGQPGYGPPPGQFNQGPFPTPQHGGFPPQGAYGGPPQGPYPPQQGQYPPPQGQYPPPQGQYPPPQGQYPPPQGQHPPPQGQHPPPQGQHPPPQGQYPPPQGQYPPPQGAFGGPPPSQFPTHHQGSFGAPQGQFLPQQGGFGGLHPSGQGFVAPATGLPSPGYDTHVAAQGDASRDADALRAAMKGLGTNEAVLIKILSKPDPLQMALLRNTYSTRIQRNLEHDVASETSSYFKTGLVALVRGPLMQDIHNVRDAIKGAGTKESVLNDVLLGRRNADMRAIKHAYHSTFGRTMEADVKGDLSMKTERLFGMVMDANRAEESAPVIPQELDRDCSELHRATEGKIGTDQVTVCNILATRSDGQIRAIAQHYQQKYHIELVDVIKKEFSGHMEDALLLMTNRALDRAMADAVQLEETMKGIGTKDELLVNRAVRVHWDRAHLGQVRKAYMHRYKRDLIARVKGETRGEFEKLLVACLEG